MEERDKCKSHPKEGIRLICKEEGCNLQPLCPKCIPKHFKHAIVDIDEYWEEKLQSIDSANIEGEKLKEEMKDPNIQQKDNILVEMKKYILDWGRILEIRISRCITSDVKSMIKSINNYEEKIINNIQENHLDLENIIEYGEENKKYKKKMTKALNSCKFSLLSSCYYKELTKREKERKDIIEKMKKDRKNMRLEIIMEEMKKKTEKGGEILFEHINQIMKREEIPLKVQEIEKVKKVEEKKEIIPKAERKEKTFQGILSASYDKSLILWDKDYKQKSSHKGKSKYIKLIELSSGRIAATTGNPGYSVEILGNNQEVLCTLRGHTNPINDICNMGESHVITGSCDETVRMWDIRSGECTQILKGHTWDVHCVHLHSSGYLLTGSHDDRVRIWDITTPHTYKEIA